MILTLIDEDGEEESFAERDPLRSLVAHLKQHDVETIVVGEIDGDGNVIWEKQFSAVTVMPSSFGKPS